MSSAQEVTERAERLLEELQESPQDSGEEWLNELIEYNEETSEPTISEEENYHQGILVGSYDLITYEEPTLVVNAEGTSFDEGFEADARLLGINENGNKVRTGFLNFKAESPDKLPENDYSAPELALESDNYTLQAHRPVSYNLIPTDFSNIEGSDPEKNMRSYSGDEGINFRNYLV